MPNPSAEPPRDVLKRRTTFKYFTKLLELSRSGQHADLLFAVYRDLDRRHAYKSRRNSDAALQSLHCALLDAGFVLTDPNAQEDPHA